MRASSSGGERRALYLGKRSLLTTEEFASALGLSPKTIRQWVWNRRVPFVRVGRAIRFKPETIDEIVTRGTVPALEAQ